MQLGSQVVVAVAEAGGCSSDSTPSLGTSICCRCDPEKKKTKKKRYSWTLTYFHEPEMKQKHSKISGASVSGVWAPSLEARPW